jgi:hypothetical protein
LSIDNNAFSCATSLGFKADVTTKFDMLSVEKSQYENINAGVGFYRILNMQMKW